MDHNSGNPTRDSDRDASGRAGRGRGRGGRGRKVSYAPSKNSKLDQVQELVFGKLGSLTPGDRGILISRVCHAYHVFPKESGKKGKPSTSPSEGGAGKQEDKTQAKKPKAEPKKPGNLFMEKTVVKSLTSKTSKILRTQSTESTKPSKSISSLHTILVETQWEAKALAAPFIDRPMGEWKEDVLNEFSLKSFGPLSEVGDTDLDRVIDLSVQFIESLDPATVGGWKLGDPIGEPVRKAVHEFVWCVILGSENESYAHILRNLDTQRALEISHYSELRSAEESKSHLQALKERKEAKEAKSRAAQEASKDNAPEPPKRQRGAPADNAPPEGENVEQPPQPPSKGAEDGDGTNDATMAEGP